MPGTFADAATPIVPYVPKPDVPLFIHVQLLVEILYRHKCMGVFSPPQSQRLLLLSVKPPEPAEPGGLLAAASTPSVPNVAEGENEFSPFIHVHWPLDKLYFHKSFL